MSDIVFLVDTGTGLNSSFLRSAIKKIGFVPEAIVNTHCHFDHVGGNAVFGLPVYIHEFDLPFLASGDDAHCVSGFFGESLPPSDPLKLPKSFYGWRVIHTPGHTQGSVCLLKDGILVSGDTLFANGVGRTDLPGGDQAMLLRSLKRLREIDYTVLLPGHGPAARK